MTLLLVWTFLFYDPTARRPVMQQASTFEHKIDCESERVERRQRLAKVKRSDWWISPECHVQETHSDNRR